MFCIEETPCEVRLTNVTPLYFLISPISASFKTYWHTIFPLLSKTERDQISDSAQPKVFCSYLKKSHKRRIWKRMPAPSFVFFKVLVTFKRSYPFLYGSSVRITKRILWSCFVKMTVVLWQAAPAASMVRGSSSVVAERSREEELGPTLDPPPRPVGAKKVQKMTFKTKPFFIFLLEKLATPLSLCMILLLWPHWLFSIHEKVQNYLVVRFFGSIFSWDCFIFMIGKGSFNGEEKKWRENLNKSLFISFAAFLSTKKTSDPWKRERQVKTVFSDKVDAAAIKRTISQTHLVLLRKRLRFRQIWSGVSHSRNSLG